MRLTESFDSAVNYKVSGKYPHFFYKFSTKPELDIDVQVYVLNMHRYGKLDHIEFDFMVRYGDDDPEEKKSTSVIFSTLSEIIQNHIREYDVKKVKCSSRNQKLLDIYEELFKRLGPDWNLQQFGQEITATRET